MMPISEGERLLEEASLEPNRKFERLRWDCFDYHLLAPHLQHLESGMKANG